MNKINTFAFIKIARQWGGGVKVLKNMKRTQGGLGFKIDVKIYVS